MAKPTRPMVRIHDLATNEVIDREMNDAEFAQHKIDLADYEAKKVQAEAQAITKTELLNRIGLTADEAQLLLG